MNRKQAIIVDTDPQSSQALRMLLELWDYDTYICSSLAEVSDKHRDACLLIIDDKALGKSSCLDMINTFGAASKHASHIIIFVDDIHSRVLEPEISCHYMEKPVNPARLNDELRFLRQAGD